MKKGVKVLGAVMILIVTTSVFAAMVSADINSESDIRSA